MKVKLQNTYTVAESENVCHHCNHNWGHETVKEVMLECAAYRVLQCSECKKDFANAYLIQYDEERPEDEMTIEL